MEKIVNQIGIPRTEYRAEGRNTMLKPKVKKEYQLEGVRYYSTVDGRTFIADVFDRTFNAPKGKVEHKYYKGKNCDGRRIAW